MGDKKFVFHLIPSGIMHDDKICVIGNGVVLDPVQTLAEIADLQVPFRRTEDTKTCEWCDFKNICGR